MLTSAAASPSPPAHLDRQCPPCPARRMHGRPFDGTRPGHMPGLAARLDGHAPSVRRSQPRRSPPVGGPPAAVGATGGGTGDCGAGCVGGGMPATTSPDARAVRASHSRRRQSFSRSSSAPALSAWTRPVAIAAAATAAAASSLARLAMRSDAACGSAGGYVPPIRQHDTSSHGSRLGRIVFASSGRSESSAGPSSGRASLSSRATL